MDKISQLRELPAQDRPGMMNDLYKKNRSYFKRKQPLLDKVIESVHCPYHFNITELFLDIIHTPTNTIVYEEAPVDQWSIKQAGGAHCDWIEIANLGSADDPRLSGLHKLALKQLSSTLKSHHPDAEKVLVEGRMQLPVEEDGLFFHLPLSFSVSFMGFTSIIFFSSVK